jgi:serine protease inhibitor
MWAHLQLHVPQLPIAVDTIIRTLYYEGLITHCPGTYDSTPLLCVCAFKPGSTRSRQPFYNSDGNDEVGVVSLMQQLEDLQYGDIADIGQVVCLPYTSWGMSGRLPFDYTAVIVLPPLHVIPEDALHVILSKGGVDVAVSASLKSQNVALSLPRFRSNASIELQSALQSIGITQAFSEEYSGLASNILQRATTPLRVSQFLQSVTVIVDEKGTEAAAASWVSMTLGRKSGSMESVQMVVNRPFAFIVQEVATQIIAFAGIVRLPAE